MINKLKEILPTRIFNAVQKEAEGERLIEEIRIRKSRQAYIVASGKNILINIIATDGEMLSILKAISKNSLYAYRDTISNGYISIDNGIRIGLIGSASVEDGEIVGVYDINEFSIRLPHNIEVKCSEILPLAKNSSVLIYSPSGEGKTTLLRSLIKELSCGINAKRICVIDTRGELIFGLEDKNLLVSVLSGYPRKIGIEIAVRTMNAQAIICDEIGDERDASAIIDAQGAGVPIIASCHGSSVRDILSHTGISALHRHRIFNYYIGIKRAEELGFTYSIIGWEEANAYI